VCPDEDTGLYQVNPGAGAPSGAPGLEVPRASVGASTAPHAAADDWATEPGPPYRGVVAIEWPAPAGGSVYACMLGRGVKISDAVSGKLITTCSEITVHADAGALVTADLTLFADEDGEPLLEGKPVQGGEGLYYLQVVAAHGIRQPGAVQPERIDRPAPAFVVIHRVGYLLMERDERLRIFRRRVDENRILV